MFKTYTYDDDIHISRLRYDQMISSIGGLKRGFGFAMKSFSSDAVPISQSIDLATKRRCSVDAHRSGWFDAPRMSGMLSEERTPPVPQFQDFELPHLVGAKHMRRFGDRLFRHWRAATTIVPAMGGRPALVNRLWKFQLSKAPRQQNPELRIELIIRIRQQIRNGDYDSAAKLETAMERLLTRLSTE